VKVVSAVIHQENDQQSVSLPQFISTNGHLVYEVGQMIFSAMLRMLLGHGFPISVTKVAALQRGRATSRR
jgi:hypothetical protein